MGPAVSTPTAGLPPGGQARAARPWALARAAVVAPFIGRERRELVFCLAGLPFAMVNPVPLFVVAVDLIWFLADGARGNPSPAEIAIAGACQGLLVVLLVSTGAARRLGTVQRLLATRLLGVRVAAPHPGPRGPGGRAWLGRGLRDR